jgi:hypothetical protein
MTVRGSRADQAVGKPTSTPTCWDTSLSASLNKSVNDEADAEPDQATDEKPSEYIRRRKHCDDASNGISRLSPALWRQTFVFRSQAGGASTIREFSVVLYWQPRTLASAKNRPQYCANHQEGDHFQKWVFEHGALFAEAVSPAATGQRTLKQSAGSISSVV